MRGLARATYGDLARPIVPRRIPNSESMGRRYYGRSLNLSMIETALRNAELGLMSDLTDLEGESLALDPHASGAISKRFGSVAALDWSCPARAAARHDKVLAEEIAADVHEQLAAYDELRVGLYRTAWGLFHGRSSQEVYWRMPGMAGRRFEFAGLGWIHPRRLSFGDERQLQLIDTWRQGQGFVSNGFDLRDYPGKFISLVASMYCDYPEKEGLGPRLLYWCFFKRSSWRWRLALTELFANGWRVIEFDKDAVLNADALDDAVEAVESLGEHSTAQLPPGAKLNAIFPGQAGVTDLFAMTPKDVDEQVSKLVLGNTGTTDATANRAESIVHKGEQDIFLAFDARAVESAWQHGVVRPIVELNWGPDRLCYAPQFHLHSETNRDADKELARMNQLLQWGMPLAESEVREIAGFRRPVDDEPYLIISSERGADEFGRALPASARLVDPVAEAERAAEKAAAKAASSSAQPELKAPTIALAPTDLAKVVSVNEARASAGLPPLTLPDGELHPDGFLSIAEFAAKLVAKGEVEGEAAGEASTGEPSPEGSAGESVRVDIKSAPAAPPADEPEPDAAERQEQAAEDEAAQLERDGGPARRPLPGRRLLGGRWVELDQPNGSPADIIDGDIAAGQRAMSAIAEQLVAAASGATTHEDALSALSAIGATIDADDLADHIFVAAMRAAMLGADDAAVEQDENAAVSPEQFERDARTLVLLELPPPGVIDPKADPDGWIAQGKFRPKTFWDAIERFQARGAVTRDAFDSMAKRIAQQAFTVAKLATDEAVRKMQGAIASSIEAGEAFRDFLPRLRELPELSGLTTSHVETVYRTNVMGAYSDGRGAQMAQPHVLAALPYWQVVTVNDGAPRQRPTHQHVHGWVMRASDPGWQVSGWPPWGYQCRCRVVARTAAWVERTGATIWTGPLPELPDEGFVPHPAPSA